MAESSAQDTQVFPPPQEFSSKAAISSMDQYQSMWNEAHADPEAFWGALAKEELHWFTPFDQVLQWEEPLAKWFVGGQTNASYNCLDAHLDGPRKNKAAIVWEGEPGDTRTLTYQELHREVCKFANALRGLGVNTGDVVTIYMPMVPELAIAMLACARIGAVHSVIFGGFSSEAIADRNQDASAKLVITADGGWRRGGQLPLKANVDAALENSPSVEKCVVLKRCGNDIDMKDGRDVWWHDLMDQASEDCPAEQLDSESSLFILYTSGSTGKPKGIRHTTGGYNLYAKKTFEWVFDHREDDIYWCTADCGWITGHSYIVYGPLSAGATTLMYEGAPNWPDEGRFWEIVDKYKVTIFYTAPTAIRAFIKWGDEWVDKADLSSLRLLGTVGEPINPAAWMWYHEKIGQGKCPIVDTWWQTETGGIMMSPLPGATPTKPGSCTKPLPGIVPQIVDENNEPVAAGEQGKLIITRPWPGMLRGIWGDEERYRQQYWSQVPNNYLAGDNAMCDEDGYYWIYGRLDDVLNVSGHRLSTTEIESALVSHPQVAEAAAVGRPHDLKGEAVAVFVTVKGSNPGEELRAELKKHVREKIGAHAAPDDIRFTNSLPKTRSGKIMRRLLRDIAAGRETIGDTTTLEDYSVLAKLRGDEEYRMKLGLINSAWVQANQPTEFGLRKTKEIGFDSIDIFIDPLEADVLQRRLIKDECDRLDLPIMSICCVALGLSDFNSSVRQFHIQRTAAYLDLAYEYQARNVLLVLGEYIWNQEVIPPAEQWNLGVQSVRQLCQHAEKLNVEIALELEPFPLSLVNNIDTMVQFLDDVDHPLCKANIDVSHLVLSQVQPEELQRLAGRAAHVHISDCDGKVHGDLPPGRGVVPFEPYLQQINQLDIDGAISIELEYSPEPEKIVQWVEEAYRETDRLMQAAGLRD